MWGFMFCFFFYANYVIQRRTQIYFWSALCHGDKTKSKQKIQRDQKGLKKLKEKKN